MLRRLQKEKYDISEFYIDDKDIDDPLEATKIQEHFDKKTGLVYINKKDVSLKDNDLTVKTLRV